MSRWIGPTGAEGTPGRAGAEGAVGRTGAEGATGPKGPGPTRAERKKRDLSQFGAYVLIVLLALFGFIKLESEQQRIGDVARDQCRHAFENREALRDVTIAISQLGLGLIDSGSADSDQVAREAQRKKLEAFQRDELTKIPPLPPCPEELP